MSGAGHMLYAIKTLKANRDLLKRRKLRQEKDYKRIIDGDKPIFKKATAQQMRAIKTKIKTYKKKEVQLNIVTLLATIFFLFLFYWVFLT